MTWCINLSRIDDIENDFHVLKPRTCYTSLEWVRIKEIRIARELNLSKVELYNTHYIVDKSYSVLYLLFYLSFLWSNYPDRQMYWHFLLMSLTNSSNVTIESKPHLRKSTVNKNEILWNISSIKFRTTMKRWFRYA